MTTVSVVMPSCSHEKYISEAVESVLGQTWEDLELIVVQDCPNDNIIKILEKFSLEDSRLILKKFDQRKGVANAFNAGLDASTGTYISFIGSDDVWRKDKLERQLSVLESNQGHVVWSDCMIIDGNGRPCGLRFTDLYPSHSRSGNIFRELCFGNFISGQSMIFAKSLIDGLRFDESLPVLNDYKFILDLSFTHPFIFINEPLVLYRMHRSNLTSSAGRQWNIDSAGMMHYILDRYGSYIPREVRFLIHLRLSASYFMQARYRESVQAFFKGILDFTPESVKIALDRIPMLFRSRAAQRKLMR